MKSWVAANCVVSLHENAQKIDAKLGKAGLAFRYLRFEVALTIVGILAIIVADKFSG